MKKGSNPLGKELAAFSKQRQALQEKIGKFAVFFGENLVGVFETSDEALARGYEKAGLKPFLVKQITTIPIVQHFTRSVQTKCLTSA